MRKIKPKKATRPFIPAASESVSNSKPNMVRTVCIRVITNPVPVIESVLNIALVYHFLNNASRALSSSIVFNCRAFFLSSLAYRPFK
jgi:hypothetical protein